PLDEFNAMIGTLSTEPAVTPADPTIHPAEYFMQVCEARNDYSFIYCISARRTEPGRRWRPIAGPMKTLLSWHTYGKGQPGFLTPSHLHLDNMWHAAQGAMRNSAEQFIANWLGSDTNENIALTPENVLIRLRSAGLLTSGRHVELQDGYFFPERDDQEVSKYEVFVATGVRWPHGAPGLLVRAIPGAANEYE